MAFYPNLLSFINTETVVKLVHEISKKEGLGKLLGEGVKRVAQHLGEDASPADITIKGLEGPAHDARSGKALSVTYGTANRGMCHIHNLEGMAWDSLKNEFGLVPYGLTPGDEVDRWDEKDKGKAASLLQDFGILPDILGMCKFYIYNGLTLPDLVSILSALTGREIDDKELLAVGERVINLQRMFNIREGITAAEDMVPHRVREIPEFGRYSSEEKCVIKDYEGMLREYYDARGWNKDTGAPSTEKLEQLGLGRL
jgi:aldehyde:ferredoxin oxidoreductase